MVKHLTQVNLYTTGMLNASPNGPNPVTRLEEFYSYVVWPASIGRLPPSVCARNHYLIYALSHAIHSDCSWFWISQSRPMAFAAQHTFCRAIRCMGRGW